MPSVQKFALKGELCFFKLGGKHLPKMGSPSIYFLFDQGHLVYIGKSKQPHSRAEQHRIAGKQFDFYSVMEVEEGAMDMIERALISTFMPPLNEAMPKKKEYKKKKETDYGNEDDEKILRLSDAAAMMGMKPRVLRGKLYSGDTPRAFFLGSGWGWRVGDLKAWKQRIENVNDNVSVPGTGSGLLEIDPCRIKSDARH